MTSRNGDGGPWIIVPNWGRFQHYSKRDPVWIKVYTSLVEHDDFRHLTFAQRGLVVSVWLAFARANGVLRVQSVSGLAGQRVRSRHIEWLNHAGWIQLSASKPLALARSRETEAEKKSATASQTETEQSDAAKAALPITNNTPEDPLVATLLREIRDADGRTLAALSTLHQRLPDAALAAALESLRHRRARADRAPLASEARYVVAALTAMEREGQY